MHPIEAPLPAEADHTALTRAVERNTAELLLRMGDAAGGHRRDGEVSWTLGGSPLDYHNAVVAARLDEHSADTAILESRERLSRAGVPGSWHVGPSMRPPDLPARLQRAGFDPDGEEPGMTARLDRIPPGPSAALAIEVVRDAQTLAEWIQALGSGFGEGPREAEWVGEVFLRIGLHRPELRHLLARQNGRVVGTATLLIAGGVGGLYFVMTVPDARRQGIGAEITRAAMRRARDAGMHHAVLTSSAMGRTIYRSVGFREVCTIRMFTWRPS
ncbi:GNAT family N-acetyltransferase [Microbacterium lushaniae]|uniref:GNAT family N-acetyltransferase n=1 Tax=Microbacterium lushaniae TaxID=2614639 RepID=A0A5J6L3K7_9MICO|nr:GNAT family N-acetyltransferase [Microbacterium lushaniae]QEW03199.1 GNAT family N-acetyltransferase [Microbacterium lushaniae]